MTQDRDLDRFSTVMAPAVHRAAELARALEGRVPNTPKPRERTAVKQALTEADTAAQELLLEELLRHYPQVSLEAEEDTPSVRAFATGRDAVVVIDPIDGTLHSYLEGSGPYAVILGLAVKGRFEAAVVALPREGMLFFCDRRGPTRVSRAGSATRVARLEADGDRVLVSHGMPQPVLDRLNERGLKAIPACGGAVAVAPLIPGVRAGLRWAGAPLGVSIRGRAGVPVAARAGAFIEGDARECFPLDLHTPASTLRIAARRGDLALLDDALAAADPQDYMRS